MSFYERTPCDHYTQSVQSVASGRQLTRDVASALAARTAALVASVKELREDGTIVYTGEGTILTIEPKTKLAKVSITVDDLKFPESGWWDIAKVEPFSSGDRVVYEIVKTPGRDYRDIVKLAPVTTQKGSGGAEAQTPTAAPPPMEQGRGDVQGGGGSEPSPTAERDETTDEFVDRTFFPNKDLARFEGWGFAGQCGIVGLTFGELSDAVEGGELDKHDATLQTKTAVALLNAADQAQRALVGRTDRSALSHKAARDMVRAVVDKRPLRGSIDDIPAWADGVQATAIRLLLLAASL